MPRKAYVALGANLGEPARQIEAAFVHLAAEPGVHLIARSRLYRSAPVGPPGQPAYCNAVCAIETTLSSHELLARLQALEDQTGRRRDGPRWGARTLDLDLLHVEGERSDAASLRLPHPHLHERNFVLVPLAEIAPALVIDGIGAIAARAATVGWDGLDFWS